MNREIKFRAWDKGAKQMYGWGSIKDIFNEHLEHHLIEVNQYTGLKDKNGKEIYEGDIIKGWAYVSFSFSKGIVKFTECSYRVEFKEGNAQGFYYLHHIKLNTIEVIGNIYENQELMKK